MSAKAIVEEDFWKRRQQSEWLGTFVSIFLGCVVMAKNLFVGLDRMGKNHPSRTTRNIFRIGRYEFVHVVSTRPCRMFHPSFEPRSPNALSYASAICKEEPKWKHSDLIESVNWSSISAYACMVMRKFKKLQVYDAAQARSSN